LERLPPILVSTGHSVSTSPGLIQFFSISLFCHSPSHLDPLPLSPLPDPPFCPLLFFFKASPVVWHPLCLYFVDSIFPPAGWRLFLGIVCVFFFFCFLIYVLHPVMAYLTPLMFFGPPSPVLPPMSFPPGPFNPNQRVFCLFPRNYQFNYDPCFFSNFAFLLTLPPPPPYFPREDLPSSFRATAPLPVLLPISNGLVNTRGFTFRFGILFCICSFFSFFGNAYFPTLFLFIFFPASGLPPCSFPPPPHILFYPH